MHGAHPFLLHFAQCRLASLQPLGKFDCCYGRFDCCYGSRRAFDAGSDAIGGAFHSMQPPLHAHAVTAQYSNNAASLSEMSASLQLFFNKIVLNMKLGGSVGYYDHDQDGLHILRPV